MHKLPAGETLQSVVSIDAARWGWRYRRDSRHRRKVPVHSVTIYSSSLFPELLKSYLGQRMWGGNDMQKAVQ